MKEKKPCDENTRKINTMELTMVEVRSDIRYIKQDLGEIKLQLSQVINKIPEQLVEKQKVENIKKEVDELKITVKKVELKMAKYIGIGIGIATVVNLAFQYFFLGGF